MSLFSGNSEVLVAVLGGETVNKEWGNSGPCVSDAVIEVSRDVVASIISGRRVWDSLGAFGFSVSVTTVLG